MVPVLPYIVQLQDREELLTLNGIDYLILLLGFLYIVAQEVDEPNVFAFQVVSESVDDSLGLGGERVEVEALDPADGHHLVVEVEQDLLDLSEVEDHLPEYQLAYHHLEAVQLLLVEVKVELLHDQLEEPLRMDVLESLLLLGLLLREVIQTVHEHLPRLLPLLIHCICYLVHHILGHCSLYLIQLLVNVLSDLLLVLLALLLYQYLSLLLHFVLKEGVALAQLSLGEVRLEVYLGVELRVSLVQHVRALVLLCWHLVLQGVVF
jgi:hypothetical protein